MRSTKIVATLGPASSTEALIETLAVSGADVFRLNFSHGSHEDHASRHAMIRNVETRLGRPLGILIDLQGPKLRVGKFAGQAPLLRRGNEFVFDTQEEPGSATRVYLPHPEIFEAVSPGDRLLVDDGKMHFRVLSVSRERIVTRVETDGCISDRKGVSVPEARLSIPALSDKDKADLAFGLDLGVDWVALSFVQCAQDVLEARALIGDRAAIVAKIEKPQALDNIAEILEAADGLMVARGDLGVEMAPEDVPAAQKRLVQLARGTGKPVIVATQMLESMTTASTPTRAEASDVATAVYDGVDAVMLSAESASGQFPVEAVQFMARIINKTEADPLHRRSLAASSNDPLADGTDAIGAAIQAIARTLPMQVAVTYTTSGSTPLRVARLRPSAAILSLGPRIEIARRLCLVWGVMARKSATAETTEDIVSLAVGAVQDNGLYTPGKAAVVASGVPFGTPGSTNHLRIILPAELESLVSQRQG
ncbi:pyruvate kinase [Paraburkholderia bannensis]|uniref:pyruvate kinase n=1 Tax=Paraburkholderia bannensis TaxID=765414 RepID=UPI002ABD81DE|nr:pyruvate kinase [Paraburkholderia bannensis]